MFNALVLSDNPIVRPVCSPWRACVCRRAAQGMVTHVTDVKPLAAVLTYLDQDSNTEVYQEVRPAWTTDTHRCLRCIALSTLRTRGCHGFQPVLCLHLLLAYATYVLVL